MTVLDIYCDSSVSGTGTGTKLDPFKTLTSAAGAASTTSGDINRIHLKSGSTFTEQIPNSLVGTVGVGFYMDMYGGRTKPIIDITTAASSWTLDGTYGFYTATLGTNTGVDVVGKFTIGALLEDGTTLPMKVYNSDHTALSASLTGGAYAYNWDTGIVYMKPRSGVPSSHTYRAATKARIAWLGNDVGPYGLGNRARLGRVQAGEPNPYSPDGYEWNVIMRDIVMKGAKYEGLLISSSKTLIDGCDMYAMGGQQVGTSGSTHLGNGITIAGEDVRNVIVRNGTFDQIFDSGVTAQPYTANWRVENVLFDNLTLIANGLQGIEVSIQNNNCILRNVTVRRCQVKNSGSSFAPAVYPFRYNGIAVIYNSSSTTGEMSNIRVVDSSVDTVLGTAFNVNACGPGKILVANCTANAADRYGFAGANKTSAPAIDLEMRNNYANDCDIATFLTQGATTTGKILMVKNYGENTPIGYKDGSSANVLVTLDDNIFNGTDAVDSSRTANIVTNFGNASTGDTSGFTYLFF